MKKWKIYELLLYNYLNCHSKVYVTWTLKTHKQFELSRTSHEYLKYKIKSKGKVNNYHFTAHTDLYYLELGANPSVTLTFHFQKFYIQYSQKFYSV